MRPSFTPDKLGAPTNLSSTISFSSNLPGAQPPMSLTLGSSHAAFRETIHGKQRLVHIRGLIAPRSCPRGGFPIEGSFEFADGSTATSKATAPCPGA